VTLARVCCSARNQHRSTAGREKKGKKEGENRHRGQVNFSSKVSRDGKKKKKKKRSRIVIILASGMNALMLVASFGVGEKKRGKEKGKRAQVPIDALILKLGENSFFSLRPWGKRKKKRKKRHGSETYRLLLLLQGGEGGGGKGGREKRTSIAAPGRCFFHERDRSLDFLKISTSGSIARESSEEGGEKGEEKGRTFPSRGNRGGICLMAFIHYMKLNALRAGGRGGGEKKKGGKRRERRGNDAYKSSVPYSQLLLRVRAQFVERKKKKEREEKA